MCTITIRGALALKVRGFDFELFTVQTYSIDQILEKTSIHPRTFHAR